MKALVLAASGLHLGYLGCYGNEWVQTPTFDRLAAEGVVFDHHYSDEPSVAGGRRAWRTGCYRFPVAEAEEHSSFPEAVDLFPLIAEHEIATYLITQDQEGALPHVAAGWQHVQLVRPTAARPAFTEELFAAYTEALDRLASCKDWLLRLDLDLLLLPCNIPQEFLSRYATEAEEADAGQLLSSTTGFDPRDSEERVLLARQNRYAGVVTYLDRIWGQALHELAERGLLEETVILLTSDSGQAVGEVAAPSGSRLWLHDDLIHIPLIMRLPGKAEAGRRIPALTQPVDLLPTLIEAFGLPMAVVHGYSLLPLARGQRTIIREYACAGLRTGGGAEWALRSPAWGFLLPVSAADAPIQPELYVKPDDRWEVNNVRQHHHELAERLEQTLRDFVEATRHPGPLRPPALPNLQLQQEERATDSAERESSP
jgi:arylsulfatase A-like enzyme